MRSVELFWGSGFVTMLMREVFGGWLWTLNMAVLEDGYVPMRSLGRMGGALKKYFEG
jgi:hypothetical protein